MTPPSKEDIFSLPNMLSLVRVGSIPVLVIMMHISGQSWSYAAAVVFFVAGLTDLADGWLARRMKKVSVLGQYLDPVADKLLVASLLIALVGEGRAPAWCAIIIIGREIAVTGMRALAGIKGFKVPSDMWGKWKTAVQMLALLLLITHYPVGGFDPHFWGMISLWVAVAITTWSGFGYFVRFQRQLIRGSSGDSGPFSP
jgi:CDP-diacylglycerol---glycerol-3-phosphate 3-phosphatidyltransferase